MQNSTTFSGHVAPDGSFWPQIETDAQRLLFVNAQNLVARWQNIVTRATSGEEQLQWMRESGIFASDIRLTLNFPDGQVRSYVGLNDASKAVYNTFVNGLAPVRANLSANVEALEFFSNALHFRFRYAMITGDRFSLVADHEAVMLKQGGRYVITDANVEVLIDNTHASIPAPAEMEGDVVSSLPAVVPPGAKAVSPAAIAPSALTEGGESLNPGGGGQLQDVVLDPRSQDSAFLLSDGDGVYRTQNGGNRWQYSSRGLAGTNVLTLAYDPQRAERLYLGTAVGLHVSSDRGQSWQLHGDTKPSANPELLTKTGAREELAIGSIVVDPNNTARVIAGVGNKRGSQISQATIFRSTDGGNRFQVVRFGPQSARNQSILQLAYDPKARQVFAATAEGGLWRGSNAGSVGQWSRLAGPSGVSDRVTGVAIAPNGTLYAAFGRANNSKGTALFASRNQGQTWQSLAGNGQPEDANYSFRNLRVDPRSSGNRHSLLTAPDSDRAGLYELTVVWNNNRPTTTWAQIFRYEQRRTAPFEIGWEGGVYGNKPRPLAYQYAPVGWGDREIWTTGDQTLFKVENAEEGASSRWRNSWRSLYTSEP